MSGPPLRVLTCRPLRWCSGAILFLRLPWCVGQAGVVGALLTFGLGAFVVTLTALSVAAISTNGAVKGGGAYFMISRALGVEFGGAVGVCFFLASSIGVTFYLVALATELDSLVGWREKDPWVIRMYAIGSLVLLLGISLMGAKYFTKFNAVVGLCLSASIIAATVNFLMGVSEVNGYTGPSLKTLADNLSFQYSVDVSTGEQMSFFKVFIVVFPAMTGVMAGANMSGDLARPGESIGAGTLWALGVAVSVYVALILVIACSVDGHALATNYNIMQDVTKPHAFIALGLICSTVSSALGSLVGAGRVLQALARDNLFPILRPFAYGTASGDEPVPAILLAFCIAASCCFIGSLNAVASIVSGIYLLVYLFTNMACFLLRVAGAPNFRPTFKYFSWHTALMGAIACAVVLFLSSPAYAGAAVLLLVLLIAYISYNAPVTGWGDVTQAIIFHQVRKYLLRLDERKAHAKFWRPSMLLLVQDPSEAGAIPFIDWGNNMKKGGLFIIGSIIVAPSSSRTVARVPALRHLWLEFIEQFRIKAFWEVAAADCPRMAVQNLVLSSGLGGMKPNIVAFPFPTPLAVLDAAGVSGASPEGRSLVSWSQRESLLSPLPGGDVRRGSTAEGKGMASRVKAAGPAMAGIRRMVENPHRGASIVDGPLSPPTDSPEAFRAPHMSMGEARSEAPTEADKDFTLEMSSRDRAGEGGLAASGGAAAGPALDPSFQFLNSKEWLQSLRDTLTLKKHVLIARAFQGLDKELVVMVGEQGKGPGFLRRMCGAVTPASAGRSRLAASALTIDVWCTSLEVERWSTSGSLALCLQLAHTLRRTDMWRQYTTVRAVCVCRDAGEATAMEEELGKFLAQYRFDGTQVVCLAAPHPSRTAEDKTYSLRPPTGQLPPLRDPRILNRLLRSNCSSTVMTFLPLLGATVPEEDGMDTLVPTAAGPVAAHLLATHQMGTLTSGLGPTLLVQASGDEEVVTDEL